MQDFGTKANDTAGPSGQLSAEEFNNLATELENAVLRAGLGLTGASVTQLASSLFIHGTKAQSFQDSGAANAYVATPISGSGGVVLPDNYSSLNGSIVLFKASNANSGASTLNVGQTTGTLLGTKDIVTEAGAALASGAIAAGTYVWLRYDSSIGAGSWVLLPASRPIATALQAQQRALNTVLLTPQRLDDSFKGANQSMVVNGYQKMPGGLIEQWGTASVPLTSGAGSVTITLPTAFPLAYLQSVAQFATSLGGLGGRIGTAAVGLTQLQVDVAGVGTANTTETVRYRVWGF